MIRYFGWGLVGLAVFVACGGDEKTNANGGGTSVPCHQRPDSDTARDCEAHPSRRRKLDCADDERTSVALAAGCVRTDPTDKDVCCPTTVVGTSPKSASVPCRQKADSDTEKDCAGRPGMPRKLDCDDEMQTKVAVDNGCVRTDPTDRDVCCPTTIMGTEDPPSGSSGTSSGSTGTSSGTSGTSGTSECTTSYAGSWNLSGACGAGTCNVSQTGCSIAITCTGNIGLTGTIASGAATVSGTANGVSVTCKVDFAGTQAFALDCGVCKGGGVRQ